VICDHFTSSEHFCTNSGIVCTTDKTTSTHELHGAEKMELASLLPFSQVFIIGPYSQQVNLRHLKKEGEKWVRILKISA
jgi:hypothetical protein